MIEYASILVTQIKVDK